MGEVVAPCKPLQNLILKGHRRTKVTALRMIEDFDAGPVYKQEELSLEGNAEEVYIRASYLSAEMIKRIIEEHPQPTPQVGRLLPSSAASHTKVVSFRWVRSKRSMTLFVCSMPRDIPMHS